MLDELQHAEYGGIKFACNETTTTAGRSLIEHNFANSNTKNIEDQGGNPRIFQLTALIFGDNYAVNRDQLLAKIEEAGPKTLIHPFFGRIENAVAMPVTYNESMRNLGRIEIPITFQISDSEGIPAVTQLSASSITNNKDNLINTASNDFGSTFNVNDDFTGNFNHAQNKNQDFIDLINSSVTSTSTSSRNTAAFRAALDLFTRNSNVLIGQPEDLGEGISDLINDIVGLYDTPEQTYSVARRFFTYGDADSPINPTTAGLIERDANNTAYNEIVQTSALAIAYQAASQTTFRTVDEVEAISRQLEDQYGRLVA